jgi:hypothetical protein
VFDGNTFQLTDSSAGDSPATGGQLTWFPAAGLLIDLGADLDAVGGGPAIPCPSGAPCPLIPAADDWQWTGSGWTLVQDLPASAAAAYFETAPVGDTAAGDVVGLDAAGATWTSTDPESGWVNASPATSPSPRSGFALAYDGSTGQVVLFGGDLLGSTAAAGEVLGDTWTWDGSTWTEQASGAATPAPSSTPSPSGSVEPVPSGVDVPPMPPAASPAVSASSATSSSAGAAS